MPDEDELELAYHEGDPIAPGYAKVDRDYPLLTAFGAAIFGGSWLASTVVGAIATGGSTLKIGAGSKEADGAWMLLAVPLAGPFATIGVQGTAARDAGVTAGLAFDGITQCIGLAMLIAGNNSEHEVLVWMGPTDGKLTVVPVSHGHSGGGLSLVGTL